MQIEFLHILGEWLLELTNDAIPSILLYPNNKGSETGSTLFCKIPAPGSPVVERTATPQLTSLSTSAAKTAPNMASIKLNSGGTNGREEWMNRTKKMAAVK